MDIKFQHFDKFLDHLITLHYYFLFFIIGLAVAAWYIKHELKAEHEDTLKRIFFGKEKSDG